MGFSTSTCTEFVEVLASKAPVPGGGGASALVGAVGTALGNMVGSLTVGKKKYADVEDLTEKILHEARVFITPGFIFGTNGKRYIRISLCAKDEKMKEALERIKKVFEK